jgi:hypothetical protein
MAWHRSSRLGLLHLPSLWVVLCLHWQMLGSTHWHQYWLQAVKAWRKQWQQQQLLQQQHEQQM